SLLKQSPIMKPYIRKILGASEFLHGKSRWCLWLESAPDDIINNDAIKDRLDSVRKMRAESKADSTRDWADRPHLFVQNAQPKDGHYILVPSVSSERRAYVPIGFQSADIISSNLNMMIPNATLYEFGIL